MSTGVSLSDSLDVIEHQSAQAEAGQAGEAHEHVDGGVRVQAAGQERPHRGAYGAEPVDDGGDSGDGLAGALERLVLPQLRTDGRCDQREGPGDEDTWACHNTYLYRHLTLNITEHDKKKNICPVTIVANECS